MELCPCGFGEPYDRCCGRYHRGEDDPPTATTLMRARYSAFAVGDEQFLINTGPAGSKPLIDPDLVWTGLFITGSTGGGLLEDRGTVEFTARWEVSPARSGARSAPARSSRGQGGRLRENSRFARIDGRWSYLGPAGPSN